MRMLWRKTVFTLILLAMAALVAYGCIVHELNRSAGSGPKKEILIEPGETVREIAVKLRENGLIRSVNLFIAYVTLEGLTSQIEAGRYEIPPSLSMLEIIELLRHGSFDIRLTFREGWRREEYLEYALGHLPVDTEDFRDEFLAKTEGLEGYLFPDTYFVAQSISVDELVDLLRANFEKKYAEVAEAINAQGITRKEAVILASLIEREARRSEEQAVIAGILLKRLKLGMPLGVCATVQYSLGYQPPKAGLATSGAEGGTWWKETITAEDTAVESPYNTYRNVGLPPAPICNPGLNALKAVAKPQASEYLYYLHDKNGNIRYARTLEEHNQNVARYLR